jgi:hypothetical protein
MIKLLFLLLITVASANLVEQKKLRVLVHSPSLGFSHMQVKLL